MEVHNASINNDCCCVQNIARGAGSREQYSTRRTSQAISNLLCVYRCIKVIARNKGTAFRCCMTNTALAVPLMLPRKIQSKDGTLRFKLHVLIVASPVVVHLQECSIGAAHSTTSLHTHTPFLSSCIHHSLFPISPVECVSS